MHKRKLVPYVMASPLLSPCSLPDVCRRPLRDVGVEPTFGTVYVITMYLYYPYLVPSLPDSVEVLGESGGGLPLGGGLSLGSCRRK